MKFEGLEKKRRIIRRTRKKRIIQRLEEKRRII